MGAGLEGDLCLCAALCCTKSTRSNQMNCHGLWRIWPGIPTKRRGIPEDASAPPSLPRSDVTKDPLIESDSRCVEGWRMVEGCMGRRRDTGGPERLKVDRVETGMWADTVG